MFSKANCKSTRNLETVKLVSAGSALNLGLTDCFSFCIFTYPFTLKLEKPKLSARFFQGLQTSCWKVS